MFIQSGRFFRLARQIVIREAAARTVTEESNPELQLELPIHPTVRNGLPCPRRSLLGWIY
jgi:hypothetical protein